MITQYVKGDLLDAFRERKFDAIVHGCNCFHTMGAGIAAAIAKQFPVAYDADKLTQYGRDKRGGYTLAETPYGKIVNGYTQFNPGRADPKYLYTAIRTLFTKLDLILPSIIVGRPEVGIPKIGAGIAGGDWAVIEQIINEVTPNLDIIVYQLDDLPEGKPLKPIHPLIGVMVRHITDDKGLELFQGYPISEIVQGPSGSMQLWVNVIRHSPQPPRPVDQLLFAWADDEESETEWLPIAQFAGKLEL